MEPNEQSSKSGENESSSQVDRCDTNSDSNVVIGDPNMDPGDITLIANNELGEINKISTYERKVAPEPGNIVFSANKSPDETIQITNMNANNTQQISNNTLEKDLAGKEQHSKETAETPSSCSTSNIDNQKIQIISNEVIVPIKQLPHHSKPFKKRSLSVDSSRGSFTESAVKKPKQSPAQETVQDVSMQPGPSNSEEKITPIQISKVKAGPKPEYTIKNSNKNASQPVPASQKDVRRSSTCNEIDNTLEIYEVLYKQISEMNNHAKTLSNKFKELTTSLDENITSSEKIYSLMDDLVALYGDDFNDSYIEYDSEENTSGSDEDYQYDNSEEVRSESTSRMNPDNTDTKWTLKYQKKEFDTTELMPGSKVYVSKTGLVKCRNLATSAPMLAKMLMPEIFTKQALLKCSFSGICVKVNGVARPPLDRDGTKALLEYVTKFSEENEELVRDYRGIRKTITGFLSSFRMKHHN